METLTFLDALRRLIEEAPSNFEAFRGANRDPAELVMTNFDGSFGVEGVSDAYVSLLDYDVPRAQLRVYEGDSDRAAAEAFEVYVDRLTQFSGGTGKRSQLFQDFTGNRGDPEEPAQLHRTIIRWIESAWATGKDGSMSVKWFRQEPSSGGAKHHHVFVEVPGIELECLDGTPETSIWRIVLGHKTPRTSEADARARRTRRMRDRGPRRR
jgi:hypothetical protein